MHHPSKHLVLKQAEIKKIVSRTLEKQFSDPEEFREFVTFALLKLSSDGAVKPRMDCWLDDVINNFLIEKYEEESKKDASE